jgi:hypothetical protein
MLGKSAGYGPLDLSFPNVAGIASYGEPEQMFSLDRFGVATGRNEREYLPQTRFDRAVPLRHDDK